MEHVVSLAKSLNDSCLPIHHSLSRHTANSTLSDFFFFFFQAEDGIRDWSETGVQTCALPIFADAMTSPALTIGPERTAREAAARMLAEHVNRLPVTEGETLVGIVSRADLVRAFARSDSEIRRSEERRVGQECRSRAAPEP